MAWAMGPWDPGTSLIHIVWRSSSPQTQGQAPGPLPDSWLRYVEIVWAYILVGGLEHVLFSPIVGMMIQSDFHICQRGRSTTNQYISEFAGKKRFFSERWWSNQLKTETHLAPARWRHAKLNAILSRAYTSRNVMAGTQWNAKDEQARLKTSRAERCVKPALVKLQPIVFMDWLNQTRQFQASQSIVNPRFWIRNRQSKPLWPCLIKRGMGLLDIVPINVW